MNNEQKPTQINFDEALEIFSKEEVKQTFIENIETLEKMRNTLLNDKLEYTKSVVYKLPSESFERWFYEQRWEVLHGRELKEIENEQINKGQILINKLFKKTPNKSKKTTHFDKEALQNIPITEVFEGKLIRSGNRFRAL
jgi:hypothetical protein